MRIYREQDANLLHLQHVTVAVLGYGNLGRPVALNLRDSGVNVIVGNIEDSYAQDARKDRFSVVSLEQAATDATIIFLAMPDEVMATIYLHQVSPYLKDGDLLVFASGYNIAYEFIEPPHFVDVGLIAPRALASNVRQAYVGGGGYPSFIAMHRRVAPQAVDRLLALALAMGALRRGAIETTFKQEVELDLFWQQALLPAIHSLLLTAAHLLVQKEGYPPEAVLTELYLSGELSEFFAQAAQQGIAETLGRLSPTGQYGVLTRTERFQESKTQAHMEAILDAIISGDFAREWASEYTDGYPRLGRIRAKLKDSTLWKLEADAIRHVRES